MRSPWYVVTFGSCLLLLLGCNSSVTPSKPQVSEEDQMRQELEDTGLKVEEGSLADTAIHEIFHPLVEGETPELQKVFKEKGWKLYTDHLMLTGHEVTTIRDMKGVTSEDFDLIVQSKVIDYLQFSGIPVNDDVLKKLPQMENLAAIRIDGEAYIDGELQKFDITDEGIQALSQCPKLDEVVIFDTDKVTDQGRASLAKLENLETLYISGSDLTGNFLKAFAGHPKLRSITFGEEAVVTDEHLLYAAEIPNLDKLIIKSFPWNSQGQKLTRAGIAALVDKKVPKQLEVPTNLIDDELFVKMIEAGWVPTNGGSFPATPEELSTLSLKNYDITDKGFEAALRFQQVTTVELAGLKISDETFMRMKDFSQLRTLQIKEMLISGTALNAISDLPLDYVVIDGGELTEEHFVALGKMKKLTSLWLPGTKFDPAWIAHLQDLPELKYLNLRSASFDDTAAEFVSKMPNLDSLIVDGTQLTDAGFETVLKAPKIETISVSQTKVTAEAIEAAKAKFPNKFIY